MFRNLLQIGKRSGRRFAKPAKRRNRSDAFHRPLRYEPLEDRSLLSISAAPEIPGMHLVDPNLDNLRSQEVYLDFVGAQNVTYHGPVEVDGIDVPPFKEPAGLAGQMQSVIASVVSQVSQS
jgi:hypothetical protein